MTELTWDRLRSLVAYDPETGEFRWLLSRGGTAKAGTIAGSTTDQGYRTISIDCRVYKAHRLAWLYVHGEMPEQQIDHVNRNPSDNRLINLRLATNAENRRNLNTYRNNKSGFRGVYFHKVMRKWRASIRVDGKLIRLGFFNTPEEAGAAYDRAAVDLHGAFARPNGSGQ